MATSRLLRPAARVAAMPVDLVVRGLIHTLALMVSGTGSLEHLGAGENMRKLILHCEHTYKTVH